MSVAETITFEVAHRLHQTGDYVRSEHYYQKITQSEPNHADAWHMLGVLYYQTGRSELAVPALAESLRIKPRRPLVLSHYGAALLACDRPRQALEAFRSSIQILERADTAFHLGLAFSALGLWDEAEGAYRRAIALDPVHSQSHNNLGNLLQSTGRAVEACRHFEQAIASGKRDSDLLYNYGNALQMLGRREESERVYREAISLSPKNSSLYHNLGTQLQGEGRFHEAIASYRMALVHDPLHRSAANNLAICLKETGEYREALSILNGISPEDAELLYNRGNLLQILGEYIECARAYQRALELKPDFAEAHNNLGGVLREQGYHEAAESHFLKAIAIRKNFPEVYNNLGTLAQSSGKPDDAIVQYQEALRLKPDFASAHSNLLLALNYSDHISPEFVLQQHLDWATRHAPEFPPCYQVKPDPKKDLRIGILSPDMRRHSVSYFLEPLLQQLHKQGSELFAYAEVPNPDGVTERLKGYCRNWFTTCSVNDEGLAKQIAEDQIDILIDLAGHTANSRLLVMCRRAAPIQLSYMGYGATTGMRCVDYRITDSVADPEGSEPIYIEKLLRLPSGHLTYQPPSGIPEVSSLPAQRNGYITFGAFQNLTKYSDRLLATWGEVLSKVPGARFLLKARAFQDSRARKNFLDRLGRLGIDPHRFDLRGQVADTLEHLNLYSEVDIVLDSFPYTGATSTCEALWMGVPVITRTGHHYVGRLASSILIAARRPEWIATSEADYVRCAVALTEDTENLSAVRAGMREHLRSAPISDYPEHARQFLQALRAIWLDWCQTT